MWSIDFVVRADVDENDLLDARLFVFDDGKDDSAIVAARARIKSREGATKGVRL